jgi:hypothetical protein
MTAEEYRIVVLLQACHNVPSQAENLPSLLYYLVIRTAFDVQGSGGVEKGRNPSQWYSSVVMRESSQISNS